jgi:CxxC-x17-CxxC domain-containing protein
MWNEGLIETELESEQTMEATDRQLTCKDCGSEFLFTVGEQRFFQERGLTNEPKRCKACRGGKQRGQGAGDPGKRRDGRQMVETEVVCAECGQSTVVPFVLKQGRPVLCRACYKASQDSAV